MTKKVLSEYGQYKNDIFTKLNFNFEPGKKILDVGCGDGSDEIIFSNIFSLNIYGIDVYKNKNIDNVKNLIFKEAGIYQIPFDNDSFDYVFLHDVLHHIDEENQLFSNHVKGLKEILRVCKVGGQIIIVEGNRYNPLFYIHMVKYLKHEHFKQSYFKKLVDDSFTGSEVKFKFFECHVYPKNFFYFWKIYEFIMEKIILKNFLAYNVAIIKKC